MQQLTNNVRNTNEEQSSLLASWQSQALRKQNDLIYHLPRFVSIGIQTAQYGIANGE